MHAMLDFGADATSLTKTKGNTCGVFLVRCDGPAPAVAVNIAMNDMTLLLYRWTSRHPSYTHEQLLFSINDIY